MADSNREKEIEEAAKKLGLGVEAVQEIWDQFGEEDLSVELVVELYLNIERLVDDAIKQAVEQEGITPEEASVKILRVHEKTLKGIQNLEKEGLSGDEAIDATLKERDEPNS